MQNYILSFVSNDNNSYEIIINEHNFHKLQSMPYVSNIIKLASNDDTIVKINNKNYICKQITLNHKIKYILLFAKYVFYGLKLCFSEKILILPLLLFFGITDPEYYNFLSHKNNCPEKCTDLCEFYDDYKDNEHVKKIIENLLHYACINIDFQSGLIEPISNVIFEENISEYNLYNYDATCESHEPFIMTEKVHTPFVLQKMASAIYANDQDMNKNTYILCMMSVYSNDSYSETAYKSILYDIYLKNRITFNKTYKFPLYEPKKGIKLEIYYFDVIYGKIIIKPVPVVINNSTYMLLPIYLGNCTEYDNCEFKPYTTLFTMCKHNLQIITHSNDKNIKYLHVSISELN